MTPIRDAGHWQFHGFTVPEQNWFKLPNEFTDIMAMLNQRREGAAASIVLYVLRHTWGYHEYDGTGKHITLDEFEHGRVSKDGNRLDMGTGLSKPTIIKGIRAAIECGLLAVEVDGSDKARVKKIYRLRMFGESISDDLDVKEFDSGGKEPLQQVSESLTAIIERNLKKETKEDNSNFEDSKAPTPMKRVQPVMPEFKTTHPDLWQAGCSSVAEFIKTVGRGLYGDEKMNVRQWQAHADAKRLARK